MGLFPLPPGNQAWIQPASGQPSQAFLQWATSVDAQLRGAAASAAMQTTSPLYSQLFGLPQQAVGESIIHLPSQPWLVRADTAHLFCGTAGTIPSGGTASLFALDPVAGAIAAQINVGTWPANEIRGIVILGGYTYFVDTTAGLLYKVDRATLQLVCVVTGIIAATGGKPFGATTDGTYLFLGITSAGASKLIKLDPANIPTSGTVPLATALYAGGTNTRLLGGDDTHNLWYDGGVLIYVTNLSGNNRLDAVNKDTMALTSTFGTNAGGAWGGISNGDRNFYSELSNDTIAFRHVGATGTGGFINMPAGSAVADIWPIGRELWVTLSEYLNTDGSVGALAIFDSLTGSQLGIIPGADDHVAGGHAPSLCPFGPDVFVSNSTKQIVRRIRRSALFTAPVS